MNIKSNNNHHLHQLFEDVIDKYDDCYDSTNKNKENINTIEAEYYKNGNQKFYITSPKDINNVIDKHQQMNIISPSTQQSTFIDANHKSLDIVIDPLTKNLNITTNLPNLDLYANSNIDPFNTTLNPYNTITNANTNTNIELNNTNLNTNNTIGNDNSIESPIVNHIINDNRNNENNGNTINSIMPNQQHDNVNNSQNDNSNYHHHDVYNESLIDENNLMENSLSIQIIYGVLKYHIIAFFFFFFIILNLKFDISYYYSIILLWLLDFYGIVTSVNIIAENIEPHNNREHLMNIIYELCMMTYKILLLISIESKRLFMIYTVIPLVALVFIKIIYYTCKRKFEWLFIVTIIFILQMANFALKYDNIIDWEWKDIFWIYWILFILSIMIAFILVVSLITKSIRYILSSVSRQEVRGTLWLTLNVTGLTILSCALVTGFINYLDTKSNDSITTLMHIMLEFICYSLVSIFITLIFLQDIEIFLHNICHDDTKELKSAIQKKPENLEIPKFLLRISSTYFGRANENDIKSLPSSSLNQAINKKKSKKSKKKMNHHLRTFSYDYAYVTKNTENAQESFLNRSQNQNGTLDSERTKCDLNTNLKNFAKISLKNLKSTKKAKLDGNEQYGLDDKSNPNEQKTEVQIQYPIELEPDRYRNANIPNQEITKELPLLQKPDMTKLSYHKRFQSAIIQMRPKSPSIAQGFPNELEIAIQNQAEKVISPNALSISDRSTSACLICFDKAPDAVYMECGHGGICYECSLEVWKTTNECYLCRKPITQVLQLDLENFKKCQVIRVISSTQMIIPDESQTENNLNNQILFEEKRLGSLIREHIFKM